MTEVEAVVLNTAEGERLSHVYAGPWDKPDDLYWSGGRLNLCGKELTANDGDVALYWKLHDVGSYALVCFDLLTQSRFTFEKQEWWICERCFATLESSGFLSSPPRKKEAEN